MDHYETSIISSIIGLILSIILIRYFGAGSEYIGAKFKSSLINTKVTTENKESQQIINTPQINETKALEKLNPIKKYLCLSDKQIKDIIYETNEEIKILNQEPRQHGDIKNTSKSKKVNIISSLSYLMDILVIISALTLGCYSLNTLSHGSLIRVLIGVFPAETKSLRNITMKFYNLIYP